MMIILTMVTMDDDDDHDACLLLVHALDVVNDNGNDHDANR